MGRPIRWTKRLWKVARGQDRMVDFYSRRETPLLLAYWQAMAQQNARESFTGDPLAQHIRRRLADYKHRKKHGTDDVPF